MVSCGELRRSVRGVGPGEGQIGCSGRYPEERCPHASCFSGDQPLALPPWGLLDGVSKQGQSKVQSSDSHSGGRGVYWTQAGVSLRGVSPEWRQGRQQTREPLLGDSFTESPGCGSSWNASQFFQNSLQAWSRVHGREYLHQSSQRGTSMQGMSEANAGAQEPTVIGGPAIEYLKGP